MLRYWTKIVFLLIFIRGTVYANDYKYLISYKESGIGEKNETSSFGDVLLRQNIQINQEVLRHNDVVAVELDGETIVVTENTKFSITKEDYLYRVYSSENSFVYLSQLGQDVQAIIQSSSGAYYINTNANNEYYLTKISDEEIPDSEPLLPYGIEMDNFRGNDRIDRNNREEVASLRVLVLYTPEALTLLNSDIVNKVYLDINNGNTSLINSEINARLELAYIGQIGESEGTRSFNDLLVEFRMNYDGFADHVHELRNRHSADLCVLLVSNSQYCGLGYIGGGDGWAFTAVNVRQGCANKFSFSHEIGHNVGCTHDTTVSPGSSSPPYNHGYVHYVAGNPGNSWRTMMAYGDACNGEYYCVRIPYWSNPYVYYNGDPTGNETKCNNARVWNERAANVEGYRSIHVTDSIDASENEPNMQYGNWRTNRNIWVSDGFVVNTGQIVEMQAPHSITLSKNVLIKKGAIFRATSQINSTQTAYPHFAPSSRGFADGECVKQNEKTDFLTVYIKENTIAVSSTIDLKDVSISMYDISGRCVQNLFDDVFLPQGNHSFTISNALPIGIYVVRSIINNKIYVNKLILR